MSEHDFVSLGINLGKDRYTNPRLTFSASNIPSLVGQLNELNEIDEVDEISPISVIMEHLATIDAAVILSNGLNPSAQAVTDGAPASPPEAGKSCKHGAMKFKEGVSSKNNKPYKGYFCTAPYGQTKCDAIFIN